MAETKISIKLLVSTSTESDDGMTTDEEVTIPSTSKITKQMTKKDKQMKLKSHR